MVKKIILFLFFLLIIFHSSYVFGQKSANQLADEINALTIKRDELAKQRQSLSSEIQYVTVQINLAALKIQETEEKINATQNEIEILTSRIKNLDTTLNHLSKLLIKKVVVGYKSRAISFLDMLFDSSNANDLLSRIKYLKTTQENNQKLLIQVQETKLNFEEQKNIREQKQIELGLLEDQLNRQKNELNTQKAAKQILLDRTQKDEAVYQRLLEQARAEYAAIKGIIAGAGTETKLREVKKGETVASVISGASCNSSGGHLHFIVQDNGSVTNPFNYLKSVDHSNCSGSGCGSSDGDSFNPSGSWDWPLNPAIELEQGYGNTWATRNTWVGRIYSFHNGIDINGSSNNVLSVSDGDIYRGSYSVGCTLPYVKLIHKDSNIVTFYLHVYSQ